MYSECRNKFLRWGSFGTSISIVDYSTLSIGFEKLCIKKILRKRDF